MYVELLQLPDEPTLVVSAVGSGHKGDPDADWIEKNAILVWLLYLVRLRSPRSTGFHIEKILQLNA